MLNKFFKFLRGYVIINVYGKNAARFLNICLRRGIKIYGAEQLENGIRLSMDAAGFKKIRPVAGKCRVRVRIAEKHSAYFTARLYKRRYPFIAAVIACIALCVLSTRYIWLVEINGADDGNIEAITEALDEIGIKRGANKLALPDGMEIKRLLTDKVDSIAWAWVYIEGAKARVEIYEKTLPPYVIDKSKPCDIFASDDGVIRKMTVREGEERVKVGDAVNAGDLIVAGTVSAYREGDAENYILVHALAEVEAYTTHTASGEYKLYYEARTPTGRIKRRRVLDIFGRAVSLPFGKLKFENYDRTENRKEINIPFFGYSGIALDTVEYSEVDVHREVMPIETALDLAAGELEARIAGELRGGAVLTDKKTEYTRLDDETIKVTVTMNFTENIAAEVPLDTK